MTRQTLRDPKNFTDAEKAEYESFTRARQARADGSLGGPFDPWLLNPELSHRLRGLGGMLWERTSLDRGLVELAISVCGRFWEANVEWAAHAPRAVEYGVAQSVLDDVYAGRKPSGRPEDELIYEVCTEMQTKHRLPIELYRRAVEMFGERGLMEVMAVIGYYTLVSMTLNAFEVEVAPGVTPPFKREP
ncbi:MAG: carboxymuconolactone decarboxylase family protein [Dehalococcoidia bacterium]